MASGTTAIDSAARGGGQQADFDTLIELIQTTIAPDTWQDVGGEGAISGFPGGVFVDAAGVLRQPDHPTREQLATIWNSARRQTPKITAAANLHRSSRWRKISLRRLQQHLERCRACDERPSVAARFLAGLQRVDLVLLEGKSGDCILAGPAEGWTLDDQGRCIGIHSGRPVIRLDDLAVMLRNAFRGSGQFLCAITPSQENLERTQQYLATWAGRPVRPAAREAWLQGLREALGRQQIEFGGIDPQTRVARVLVEADHHMKLVGLGLVPPAGDLVSYLDALVESTPGVPAELGILRWWFTLKERCVQRSAAGQVYFLQDQVVRLLSENELLTAQGQRIHTGRADPLNRRFARDFTENFSQLAKTYPVYAELDNVFRLAIVAAVLRQEDLPARTAWSLDDLLDDRRYPVPRARAPREVLSVIHYRELDRSTFLAAVSGGVTFQRDQLYARGLDTSPREASESWGPLQPPQDQSEDAWWWD